MRLLSTLADFSATTKVYETVSAARAGIADYIDFYNARWPHRAHRGQTPDAAYFASLPSLEAAA